MSKILTISAFALGLVAAPAAFAQTPAPAAAPAAAAPAAAPAAPKKFSSKSTLGELMANAAAKEVLKKHLAPVVDFIEGGGGDVVKDFTVDSLLDIPEAGLTPEVVKALNEDLDKVPAA